MYVGIAKLTVAIAQSHSLKEKRMVIRRIKDRVRERVGVVVNEVAEHENWQRAELGCAVASADRAKALELIDEVVRVAMTASGGQVVGIAKDAWTFDAPAVEVPTIDDRTGSGDKAIASDDWVPDDWREEWRDE
ncbi:MAG TPA: DUF503 domain-containing protein [Kofleriaceae bacterium]|nr:DUF503 domain-containing protein [Kofleriaceae bacterium]